MSVTKKVVQVCDECGSSDVSSDATARWSVELQQWVLVDVNDGSYCEKCEDNDCRLDTVDADVYEAHGGEYTEPQDYNADGGEVIVLQGFGSANSVSEDEGIAQDEREGDCDTLITVWGYDSAGQRGEQQFYPEEFERIKHMLRRTEPFRYSIKPPYVWDDLNKEVEACEAEAHTKECEKADAELKAVCSKDELAYMENIGILVVEDSPANSVSEDNEQVWVLWARRRASEQALAWYFDVGSEWDLAMKEAEATRTVVGFGRVGKAVMDEQHEMVSDHDEFHNWLVDNDGGMVAARNPLLDCDRGE